jgi:hypothetical protein
MKPGQLLLGLGVGLLLVAAAWSGGWVQPPEALQRRLAAFEAVYPGPVGEAKVIPIPCPLLKRVRFYQVCTAECRDVSRLVAVKGLRTWFLVNLSRIPSESLTVTRGRINRVVGREGLRLEEDGVRRMTEFYLKLDGLFPELVVSPGEAEQIDATREAGYEALGELMDRITGDSDGSGANGADRGGVERIEVERRADGFEATMLYWDTSRAEAPLMRLRLRMAPGGQVRDLRGVILPQPRRAQAPPDAAAPNEATPPDEAAPPDKEVSPGV